MPVPRRVGHLVQLVQRLALPQRRFVLDGELGVRAVQGHGVGGEGLQLDRVRTRLGRGIHQGQRPIERLVVVARHLGNDERATVVANLQMVQLNHGAGSGVCGSDRVKFKMHVLHRRHGPGTGLGRCVGKCQDRTKATARMRQGRHARAGLQVATHPSHAGLLGGIGQTVN